jgi:hypothetical protein
MSNLPTNVVMVQQGGTCWFHAALNGWLLSSKGRELLLIMLREFKKKYSLSNSNAACPRRGTLPLGYFWHYVENVLTRRNLNLKAIVLKYKVGNVMQYIKQTDRIAANMTVENYLKNGPNLRLRERLKNILEKARVRPNNFVNSHLIHNIGLRNSAHPVGPLTLPEIYRFFGVNVATKTKLLQAGIINVNSLRAKMNKSLFNNEQLYNKMSRFIKAPLTEYGKVRSEGGGSIDSINLSHLLFGPAYSQGKEKVTPSTFVFSEKYHENNPLELTVNGVKFVLSHAYLSYGKYKGGMHAICGFIYKGRQFLSDSNHGGFFMRCNWATKENAELGGTIYGGEFTPTKSLVFYVRENVTNYVSNMNALAARRNVRAMYSKINSLLMTKGVTHRNLNQAYQLLKSIPNKNDANYKYFKQQMNERINANIKGSLNHIKYAPNTNSGKGLVRYFINAHKNMPQYEVVRNAARKRLNAMQKT